MNPSAPVTASADPARELPGDPAERLDRIAAALASLHAEQRRCERLGLETPLARCVEQRRYWEFLRALFVLEPARESR